mgnify:FL=1
MFSPPGWIRREISDGIPHPFPIFPPVFHIYPYSKDIQILFALTFSLPFCNLPFIFPEFCFSFIVSSELCIFLRCIQFSPNFINQISFISL